MNKEHLLTTESGRYYVNVSEKIISRSDVSWVDVLNSLSESEEIWRQWLFDGLQTPFRKHAADPLSSFRTSRDDESDDPTFLISEKYDGAIKYRFVIRTSIYIEWMERNGYLQPMRQGEKRKKLSRTFDVDKTLRSLTEPETKDMWSSILIDKDTRISINSSYLESTFRYNVDYIRDLAHKSMNKEEPLDFLNRIFEDHLPASKKNKISGNKSFQREARLSVFRFLTYLSNSTPVVLPAPTLAKHVRDVARVYSGFMKGYAIRRLAGERCDEIEAGMAHLAVDHEGQRQLRLVDIFTFFCASNYGSSGEFAPEFLNLVQTATSGHFNNIRPYFNGISNHYQIPHDEYKKWDILLKGRNSSAVIDGPFSMFQLQPHLVKAALPVQVRNFEEKTGLSFPNEFGPVILGWVDFLEKYIRKLPRQNLSGVYSSLTHWLFYLCTLSPTQRPKDFMDVDRDSHIRSDSDRNTFMAFLKRNSLETRARVRDLYQVMRVWQSDNPDVLHLPIVPELDWTNRSKSFRTKRKAIPELIVETLTEENARECAEGIPYAMYRNWVASRGTGGSLMRLDGEQAEEKIPSVPATIDCILQLGMRSSSARWLDSGEGDEFKIDYNSVSEVPNSALQSKPGEQSGFLQRMQVGPNQWVPSILMLRNKTLAVHEIPYAPKDLVQRLTTIRERQEVFNPISEPIRAVEDESRTNNIEDVALVFPLFRDPNNALNKPISYSKVTGWWENLLRLCEPIVNAKRERLLGEDCEYYHFFDAGGKPLWDIHSIRVTVVTALLEMGVSPTIVQHLVGHKSPTMTLYYEAVETRQVSTALAEALEKRRITAAEAIGNAGSIDELEDAIDNILGGIADGISGAGFRDAAEYAIANGKNLKSGRSAFSVFSHGICPGGDCAQGGEKRGNTHLPVHRDMACSRCRFRITGPAFLAGLELNANILMSEVAESSRREERLNEELLGLSRAGRPTAILESRVAQEQEYRDEVWADWAAEYRTIRECLDLAQSSDGNNLPVLPDAVSMHISEKSRLSMLQDIIGKSQIITGASIDLPPGVVEVRNDMLWDIASKSGDIAKYLISLEKEDRDLALHEFGDFICKYSEGLGEDPENVINDGSKLLLLEQLWANRQENGGRYDEE